MRGWIIGRLHHLVWRRHKLSEIIVDFGVAEFGYDLSKKV